MRIRLKTLDLLMCFDIGFRFALRKVCYKQQLLADRVEQFDQQWLAQLVFQNLAKLCSHRLIYQRSIRLEVHIMKIDRRSQLQLIL